MKTKPQSFLLPDRWSGYPLMGGMAISLALLLTACGGDSDSGGSEPDNTPRPTAVAELFPDNIGPDETTTLVGRNSTATTGSLVSYRWSLGSVPEGSSAQILATDQADTSFTPSVYGSYEICLTVSDDVAQSMPSCKELTVRNPDPQAMIKPASAVEGQRLQLDASSSLPPTGGDASLLKYHWELVSKPEGSNASLDNSASSSPRITTDLEGSYTLRLTVSYLGKTNTAEMTVSASHVNTMPVASFDVEGGEDINNWEMLNPVMLKSTSSDADGDDLQYRWSMLTPTGSETVMNGAKQANASFTPDKIGWYTVYLSVYDGTAVVKSGQTRIMVTALPEGHVNVAPVASIKNFWVTGTNELETGYSSAYFSTSSYDIESRSTSGLVYEFEFIEAPAAFDKEAANQAFATGGKYTQFEAIEGAYRVSLRVSDGELWSEKDYFDFTVLTGANNAPEAIAETSTRGRSYLVGNTVTFDSSYSSDDRDNELSGYQWTMTDQPDGSSVSLVNANSASPTLVPDQPGPYSVTLMVQDSLGAWSNETQPITVLAKSQNNPPISRPKVSAEYDEDQPFVIYPTIDGKVEEWDVEKDNRVGSLAPYAYRHLINPTIQFSADAFDPDGDSLVYLWSLLEEPNGSAMARPLSLCLNGYTVNAQGEYTTPQELYNYAINVREWECDNVSLSPTAPGTYSMQLMVTDAMDTSQPMTLTIEAAERDDYPSLLLEDLKASELLSESNNIYKYYGRQQLFPYETSGSFSDAYLVMGTAQVVKRYQLTAFDRDYTISNLAAVSQEREGGYQARFEGLQDGQIIKQGETVAFSLVIVSPEEFPPTLIDYLEFNGMTYESKGNQGEGLNWHFEITEKTGWSFDFEPTINAYSCHHDDNCNY